MHKPSAYGTQTGPAPGRFPGTWLAGQISAFHLYGLFGLASAVALTQCLGLATGRAPLILGALTLAALATFYALALVTKIVVGGELLVYYHHQTAVLAVTALLLLGLGQPALPYLDLVILGVGMVAAWGRLGCLAVGCCHGRPHRVGITYGPGHVIGGFDARLVGVRLLPTQLIESAWLFVVLFVGSGVLLAGAPAGTALALYLVAYACERFWLEFLRGDAGRPYWLSFSEAQWWSLGLLTLVAGAGAYGLLPAHWWHLGALAVVSASMLVVSLRRRRSVRHRLLAPAHILELATVVVQAQPDGDQAGTIAVQRTSQGLQLSRGRLVHAGRLCDHYALSLAGAELDAADARAVAELILQLRRLVGWFELIPGGQGVFHLVIVESA